MRSILEVGSEQLQKLNEPLLLFIYHTPTAVTGQYELIRHEHLLFIVYADIFVLYRFCNDKVVTNIPSSKNEIPLIKIFMYLLSYDVYYIDIEILVLYNIVTLNLELNTSNHYAVRKGL